MKQFFRFEPAPTVGTLTAFYGDYTTPEPTGDEPEVYIMPVKRNDQISFFIPALDPLLVDQTELQISIIQCLEVVAEEVGTVEPSGEAEQLKVSVTIPNLDSGYYRFLIHGLGSEAEWVQTAVACEVDGNGNNTGWQLITEERDDARATFGYVWSNEFEISDHFDTKLIRYRGEFGEFGFDYSDETFYQQVRLHVAIAKPDRPILEKVYRQSNGVRRFGTVIQDKKFELRTGYLDEETFDALAVALKHSEVYINSKLFFSVGSFSHEFTESMTNADRYYELSSATIELYDQGYNERNGGCGDMLGASVPCESYAKFVARQKVGLTETSENVFVGKIGQYINAYIEIQPAVENPQFTYSGVLPTGLNLFKVDKGFAIVGTPTALGTSSIVVKSLTEENVCGSATIGFTIEESQEGVEYSSSDYNVSDYN